MAFSVIQSGSTLYGMNTRGALAALTLPTGVTVDANKRLRGTVFKNYAVLINSVSRPLTVDSNLTVRVLTPTAPANAPTPSAGSAGTLSGTYMVRQTEVILDQFGNLLSESDFSPSSAAQTLTSQKLRVTLNELSPDAVSLTRLYRTANGGAVFFQWIDIEGNTQLQIEDDTSDAGLATFAAPALGTPPNLFLVSEFRNRLFGVGSATIDTLNYTEVGAQYAWPSDNEFQIARIGADERGITGLLRRRDAFGLGRSNGLFQLTGTDDTDFRIITLSENCGVEAPDSVCIYRDVAYFLWKDGVYQWDASGIKCLSDGRIRRLFTRKGTFNLDRLPFAFAHIDPLRHKYRLFLASASSNVENCWIEYDFVTGHWWGPHYSRAFTPTSAFLFSTESGLFVPVIGARDGFVRLDRNRRTDDAATAIDFDVVTSRHEAGSPTLTKMFGTVSVSTKPHPGTGGILDVQTAVGEIDELRATNEHLGSVDLTQGYTRLSRVGAGKAFKLRFRNNQSGVDVNLRGFELDDVSDIGQR